MLIATVVTSKVEPNQTSVSETDLWITINGAPIAATMNKQSRMTQAHSYGKERVLQSCCYFG